MTQHVTDWCVLLCGILDCRSKVIPHVTRPTIPLLRQHLGLIVEGEADTLSVEPLDQPGEVQVSHDCVFPAVDEGAPDVDDNCKPQSHL